MIWFLFTTIIKKKNIYILGFKDLIIHKYSENSKKKIVAEMLDNCCFVRDVINKDVIKLWSIDISWYYFSMKSMNDVNVMCIFMQMRFIAHILGGVYRSLLEWVLPTFQQASPATQSYSPTLAKLLTSPERKQTASAHTFGQAKVQPLYENMPYRCAHWPRTYEILNLAFKRSHILVP